MKKFSLNLTLLISICLCFAFSWKVGDDLSRVEVSRIINVSSETIWQIVAEDFDKISNSHPKCNWSKSLTTPVKCEVGAKRKIHLSTDGDRYMIEEIEAVDRNNMTISFKAIEIGGMPIKEDVTKSFFKVKRLEANQCILTCVMQFDTSPSFMSGMLKSNLEGKLKDYFVGVEHYAKTGETVNRGNFERIAALYKN